MFKLRPVKRCGVQLYKMKGRRFQRYLTMCPPLTTASLLTSVCFRLISAASVENCKWKSSVILSFKTWCWQQIQLLLEIIINNNFDQLVNRKKIYIKQTGARNVWSHYIIYFPTNAGGVCVSDESDLICFQKYFQTKMEICEEINDIWAQWQAL